MGRKRSVRDAPVKGRRVLVRVDFNVPLTPQGSVADPRRILEALPTIRYLQAAGAKVVLLSHLGRPGGRRDIALSLRPVARKLSEVLGQPVPLSEDCVGVSALHSIARLNPGDVVLLENLRFHAGEEANDPAFSSQLAQLGEIFVEDAFGSVHRAHASTVGVAKRLPAYVGLLVERETEALARLVDHVEHPYVAIVGGAKVTDKMPLLGSFLGRVDTLLVGGLLALPLLTAQGTPPGKSAMDPSWEAQVRQFLSDTERVGMRLGLPEDWLVELPGESEPKVVAGAEIPTGAVVRDIGPKTQESYRAAMANSKTVFWNGPLGVAEDPRFVRGTRDVLSALRYIAGFHVCAGGDSARVAEELGISEVFQYVSTGGGAALEFIQGGILPGLAVIPDA